MSQQLTIGKLVQAAQVSVETIRHYEHLGLITLRGSPGVGRR